MKARAGSSPNIAPSSHAHRPRGSRRGGVGIAVAASVALGAVTYLSFSLVPGPADTSSTLSSTNEAKPVYINRWTVGAMAHKRRAEADRNLVRALSLVGVSPESLTAAGVSSQSVATVVGNARTYLSEHGTALWAAMDSRRAAVADKAAKEKKVVAGIASENDKSAANTACTALVSACSSSDNALNGVYAAATASLSSEQKAILATLRANKGREFDLKYLTVSRTEAQWTDLRDALANARIAAKTGDEPDSGAASLVSSTDGETAVGNAASGLTNNLAGITTAWSQAVSG